MIIDIGVYKNGSKCINFYGSDTIQISGTVTPNTTVNSVGINVDIHRFSDGGVVASLLDTAIDAVSGVSQTLYEINGNAALTWTPRPGEFYAYLSASHTSIQNVSTTCNFAVGQVRVNSTGTASVYNGLADSFDIELEEFINTIGVLVKVPNPEPITCPNCLFDIMLRKSTNIYDSNNPYDIGTELHRPFQDGAMCPVCLGRGIIDSPNSEITATVNWNSQSQDENGIIIDKNVCEVKTVVANKRLIERCEYFYAPIYGDTYVKCKKIRQQIGHGIGTANFIVFFGEVVG